MALNLINYALAKSNTQTVVAEALTGVATITADNEHGVLIITMKDGSVVKWTPPTTEIRGKSLEFNWRGTELGIRVEGETEYQYVDLKGDPGAIGNADLELADGNLHITSDGTKQGVGVDSDAIAEEIGSVENEAGGVISFVEEDE